MKMGSQPIDASEPRVVEIKEKVHGEDLSDDDDDFFDAFDEF